MVQVRNSKQWAYIVSILFSAIGALAALAGSWLAFSYQVQVSGPGELVWPLPGLVLVDWSLLAVLGFAAAYFSNQSSSAIWQRIAWFVPGALAPLIVLGAFSIGALVLLSCLFLFLAAVLITLREGGSWAQGAVTLLAGAVINLALLLLVIVSGRL